MGQKPNFDCSSDLGSRDMDRNHDWINDPRERYTDLVDIDTFLSRNPGIVNLELLANSSSSCVGNYGA
ncbi:hypothetical protein RhiirA5_365860 [Rhizophagus irregularis]|nr:hypothetical protein RhiirA5_365860 [Rhizophagus irregularis]